MDSSVLSLTYLEIRGLAEPINLMLADANINYRDERLPLSQWNVRKAEGTYGPVYGQPFHDLPTLTVKTAIGTVILAGIFTILEYLEDAFDIHAGKDILYKAKINMIRDASMSFLQEIHNYLNSETWDNSEERTRFRELRILPFLLDLSRHIGINGVQGEFGADPNQPLTAAGACVFEALDLIEQFFPSALNDWPVLAILRGRISIRPNIQNYLRSGKRQQKVSLSRYETPERVAYLLLRNIPQPSRKSDVSAAPSIYSTSETNMGMPGSPSRHVLKKKHHPSSASINKVNHSRPSMSSKVESEESGGVHHHPIPSSPKNDETSSRFSIDVSEGKRRRSHSFTSLFLKKRGSKTKLQPEDHHNDSGVVANNPKRRSSYKPSEGDARNLRNVQQPGSSNAGPPLVQSTILSPPFFSVIPKTLTFPMGDDNVRSSVHSDSVYSSASGAEYHTTVLAI